MGILYQVDPVAKGHDYKQKGATCWYYVAKMMLKFHSMYDTEAKGEVYDQWKALHQVRKAIYELNYNEEDRYKTEALLRNLDRKLLKAQEGVAKANKQKEENLFDDVKELNEEIARLEQKGKYLGKAKELLKELSDKGLANRNRALQTFVPSGQFVGNVFSPGNLEKWLHELGPLYVGGGLITVKSEKSTGPEGVGDVLAVTELKEDSKHAILLVGATKNDAYYLDPHQSNQVRQVARDLLFKEKHARRREDGKVQMLYAKCPAKEEEGTCVHCKTRGKEIKEV